MACSLCGSITHVTGECHDTNISLGSSPGIPAHTGRTPIDPLIGQQVSNYRILKLLGTGGMGSVYLGEHSGIGSKVAIKFLHEHLASNADLVQRFYAEARAVNVIGHANIVSIFDMNVLPPNRYYLVMEYLEGQSLEEPIKAGPMPMTRAVPILSQVCDALDQAHAQNVVHRDLKPENVMLVRRGRQHDFAKILDFGIAKLHVNVAGRKTATGVIIGTPDYMAPEQAGGEFIDGRCDQYSLGIIAYELATGKTPFSGLPITAMLVAHLTQEPPAPHTVNPQVPLGVSQAIMKAIAKKPEARFASCGDFAQALEEAMQGTPPPPKPPSGNLPWSGAESGQQYASPSPVAQSVSPVSGTPIAPPKVQTPPPAHVAAAPPRFVTSFEAGVKFEDGREASLAVGNMSRAGCFLVSDFLPPIFSRVTLTMPSAGELPAEVVRHVPQEQATAWNMPAGFAVQFWEVKPEQREALEALTHGKPLAPAAPKPKVSRADDAVAERTLGELRKRIQGDHYVVLSLGNDCEVPAVRTRGRELERQLLALKDRALSDGQLLQVEAALVRIREAIDILGTVQKRAEFDGLRFNWRGVGMCLAAGLRVPELDEPRRRFLAANPGTEARVQLHMLTADGFEKSGALTDALRVVEQILNIDPLNWELHNRRKLLLRRLSGSNSGAFPRA